MWLNPQETADLVAFTEEILNEKLHFLSSVAFFQSFPATRMLDSFLQIANCARGYFDYIWKFWFKVLWNLGNMYIGPAIGVKWTLVKWT